MDLRITPSKGRGISIRLVMLVAMAFLGVLGAIGATLTYSQLPSYCARCHSMRHAYQNWACTIPKRVGCIECHTGSKVGTCLSLEIEDSTCMKASCHSQEKLFSSKKAYNNTLPFSHKTHMDEWTHNIRLRCTACHSYQGNEKHFDIDKNTCYVCHFAPGEGVLRLASLKDRPLWECSLCHSETHKKIEIYEKEFDHADWEKKPGVECNSCHNDESIHGSGRSESQSCYYCHDRFPPDYSDVEKMHYDHMVSHKVNCLPCHEEIVHEIYRDKGRLDSCEVCSTAARKNTIQSGVMRGEGGKGVTGSPDPMSLATVSCGGCHHGPENVIEPARCNACHGKGFDKIFYEQKELVVRKMNTLKEILLVAEKGEGISARVEEARHNYNLITSDGSYGVHNIKYVKELLDHSILSLQEVLGSDLTTGLGPNQMAQPIHSEGLGGAQSNVPLRVPEDAL